ncbi:hypothetical protein TL16_g08808 [Triparma laevis f. inornata]|uniref:CN hydrolase domain-containing protein n=2 Tax=Triparma laevis TaxID=1534972 RepID=A0A9W7FRG6_9STRA|nr:hypothetical protein TL16_g08808 [Triparma laevis f. inornata]GMI16992.1 hypothetical protein TrLO_g4964 [Triparma laevis f. longispina]
MKVAAAQIFVTTSLATNLEKILQTIQNTTDADAEHVILFPECALTGYDKHAVETQIDQVPAALEHIQQACKASSTAAIVGTAKKNEQRNVVENVAVVIDNEGNYIGCQAKIQLVPTDNFCSVGQTLHTFKLYSIVCSIIICHDSRHPELVRLPVLSGARVIFYQSWETWHDDGPVPTDEDGRHLKPYEAQAVARAVENRVFLVHSNVAGVRDNSEQGSHGSSRIISPQGDILQQAKIWGEETVSCTIDPSSASALYAREAENKNFFLHSWMMEGVNKVTSLN